jgi:hypothetical protein
MMLRSMFFAPHCTSAPSREVVLQRVGRSFGICQGVELAGQFQPHITLGYDDFLVA